VLHRITLRELAFAATLVACVRIVPAEAQSRQSLDSGVPSTAAVAAIADSIVRAYFAAKGPPGLSVAISRGDETLYERAYGISDTETKRLATPGTLYKIGSVSKQFTAVLVLRQVERGKIALTDSIGRYLTKGLRPEWRSATIEQLLNHTAGLPADLNRQGPSESEVTADTMIAWAARDTMIAPPGKRFAYSNVGYLLLGALVEKLYAKPYGEVIHDEIALPLGLRSLRWCTDPRTDSTVAKGHISQGAGKHEPSDYAHPSKSLGGGALCSTGADLSAWNRALHGGRVLSAASYALMITPRAPSTRYGFGLYVQPTPWGAKVIAHAGAVMGFTAANAWFPGDSLSITVLQNTAGDGISSTFPLDIARAISAQSQPKPPSGAGTPR
jgi:CubicO group peptidase (beta-lactamase class C family)